MGGMLHPLYVMATVTTLVALAAVGTMVWQISPRDGRRTWVLALLVIGCFMSPLAFHGVRRPLIIRPLELILKGPEWDTRGRSIARDAIRLAYAPLTEEPAKLAPWFLLLAVRAPLWPAKRMIAPLALAAGLGFAAGEIWLVAGLIVQANDQFAGLHWYEFGGFFGERLMTCLSHTLFALPTIALSRRGWKCGLAGLALGMLLHGAGNAPIVLMHRETFGWKPVVWSVIVQLWVARSLRRVSLGWSPRSTAARCFARCGPIA